MIRYRESCPLKAVITLFVCGDLAEAPEAWQSLGSQIGYSMSLLPSPVESPEGFNPNEFMVNIGLALKELLTEKAGANFSSVNLNVLPEVYVPPHFSILRVLVPVGIVIGIGLIIFGVILVQTNRAHTETLRSQLALVQSSVTQKQSEIATLSVQVGSLEAAASELDSRITTMEQERATFYEDLAQIVSLAAGKVTLSSVSHGGSAVTVDGVGSSDGIFSYARDLRSGGRFSQVWIKSISSGEGGFSFEFSLTK